MVRGVGVRWLALIPAAGLLAAVAIIAVARNDDDPSDERRAATSERGQDGEAAAIPVVNRGLAGSYPRFTTLKEVPAEFVGVITPVAEAEDYWPDAEPQNEVWARWLVRVDEAVTGPFKAGDTFLLAGQGGVMNPDATFSIETGVMRGSAKPVPGGPAVLIVYGEYPRFQLGRAELVFVQQFKPHPGPETLWTLAAISARFVVGPDRSLSSPLPAHYQTIAETVEGQKLNDIAAQFRP